ncbi:hypothetical protein GCM10010278_79420 [Streptomyces melanogenes]|nr:hypothetical protein GCM10010278_79420 [Streptomyces melanogenes]
MWLCLSFAAFRAGQAVRDAFAFVPGFVPWDGECRRRFVALLGAATWAAVVAACIDWGKMPLRTATGRFTHGLGLRPAFG